LLDSFAIWGVILQGLADLGEKLPPSGRKQPAN
jgi:hypothetical protein